MPPELRRDRASPYEGKLLIKKPGRPLGPGPRKSSAERQRAYRLRAKLAQQSLQGTYDESLSTPVEFRATLSVSDAYTLREYAERFGVRTGELLAFFAKLLREGGLTGISVEAGTPKPKRRR